MKLKITTLIILFLSLTNLTNAQSKTASPVPLIGGCTMKVKDSPTVLGLNLGMTRAEVRKEYPKMVFTDEVPKEELEAKDVLAGLANKPEITNPAYKKDLAQVSMIFGNKNKILAMTFIFDGLIKGNSVKDLAAKVSDLYKLPVNLWEPTRGGSSNLGIFCDDFAVFTTINSENKQILFLARKPETLTEQEKKILQP